MVVSDDLLLRVWLFRALLEVGTLQQEVERLLVDNAELSDECDQWGEKLAEVWSEVQDLRAQLAQRD